MSRAHIGKFNLIRVNVLRMDPGSRIVKFNRFNDVNIVSLATESMMLSYNVVLGMRPGLTPFKDNENFYLGEKSLVTVGHLFDVSESIEIGRNVAIGGRGSEIWTHGTDLKKTKIQAPVTVGDNVYLASGCIVVQGVSITDGVSIGAGSVVGKTIAEPGFYVSSQIIRKGDQADYSEHKEVVEYNSAYFLRK